MKRLLRLMVIIIVIMAILVGGGVFAYLHFKSSKKHPKTLTLKEQQALQVALPQMTTNLQGGGIVQFTLKLQANDTSTENEIKTMIPSIQDQLNRIMRENTATQLNSTKGLAKLKTEIQSTVDSQLPKGNVSKVLFVNILTQ